MTGPDAGGAPGAVTPPDFRVCVYCGARTGHDPRHLAAAQAMGRAIATQGAGLVFGGGHVGLMGAVADAALAAGGHVLGVIPERLLQRELGHPRLQELRVVATMHDRKHAMAAAAHAFVALPGGLGTLEELFETWTWHQLGYHRKPIGLLNVAGYFDPMLAFLRHMGEEGFLAPDDLDTLCVDDDPERLVARLRDAA